MLEIEYNIYTYALILVMITSVTAILVAIFSIKSSQLPFESIKLFRLYFLVGLIGWCTRGLQGLLNYPVDLTSSGIAYIVASFILFIAVVEFAKNWWLTWVIAFAHLIMIINIIISNDDQNKILIVSIYALFIYAAIFAVSINRAKQQSNIGYLIIGIAALIVLCGIPFQLYHYNNVNLSFSYILITSAVGFLLVGIGFLVSILTNEHKQLTALALKDPLTGLLNRRGLEFSLQTVLTKAKRDKSCISAVAIDIDYFKKINDSHGHDGGDLVLQALARRLTKSPRASDVCCRLGGEEFVIILDETKMTDAVNIAERIRKIIEKIAIEINNQTIKITASFGVSNHCGEINLDSLLKDADKALYKAKADGRNRVCMTSSMNEK